MMNLFFENRKVLRKKTLINLVMNSYLYSYFPYSISNLIRRLIFGIEIVLWLAGF